MRNSVKWIVVGSLLGMAASPAWAKDLEAAERTLTQAWDKIRSLSLKYTYKSHVKAPNVEMKMDETGTFEWRKEGDKLMGRREGARKMVQKMGDNEVKTDQSTLWIADGEFEYDFSDLLGQKLVLKRNADPGNQSFGNPRHFFEALKKTHDLSRGEDAEVNGRKVIVIVAAAKKDEGGQIPAGMPVRDEFSFDAEIGVLLKSVSYGADKEEISVVTHTDVKIDADIDPKRFKFEAPEGAEIIDQTTKRQ